MFTHSALWTTNPGWEFQDCILASGVEVKRMISKLRILYSGLLRNIGSLLATH